DRAFGRVPSGAKLTVVMAPAQGSPWVARALASDPNVELLGSSLAGLPGAGVPRDALVVLNGACPADAPGGDLLILDPPPGPCGTALVGAKLVTPLLTSWAEVDPRLRFLSLDGVDLRSARRLEADTPQGALVQSREGTLIADASSPGRSVTLVGFDVGESNWPLKASFVLFMRNVVELARSHRVRGAEAPGRVGDAYSLRVPVDVAEVDLESPGGSRQKLSARDGLCVVPNLRRAGFYFASYGGKTPGSALFAANLTSERESDLRPHELPTRQGNPLPARSAAELSSAVTDWSWPLAAVSLLLIALDVWWVTRTPRTKALGLPRAPDRESEALR
ncbi:MAG TPA: VWA domain-containing protein, partial [Polyangiaceae bacterium]|nr:VWA domain-containing protein [Polyangiaceae bacterium]